MASPNIIPNNLESSRPGQEGSKRTDLVLARVSSVLLDDKDPKLFNELGGWKSIGSIKCRPFINYNDPQSTPIVARPINGNITRYPLVNEIVVIYTLVSKEAQNNFDNYKPEVYYTDILSLFSAVEENAAPDESYLKLNPNEKYVTGRYSPSGKIKRLIKAAGDVTIEGRRGNSIRFGSNMEGFNTPWKAKTINPILIISNNPTTNDNPDVRFENINKDGSTLVMMSGHNISFEPSSDNFDSYKKVVSIDQKNNVVVADPAKPQPTDSLKAQDAKGVSPDKPTTNIPVSSASSASNITNAQEDDNLPDREDLFNVEVKEEIDYVPSLGRSGTPVSPPTTPSTDLTKGSTGAAVTGTASKGRSKTKPSALMLSKMTPRFLEIANKFQVNPKALIKVIETESALLYENAALYLKIGTSNVYSNKPQPGYKLVAAGIISFTNQALKCIGLTSLDQILGTSYEYQLDLMEKFMNCNKSDFYKADDYALYGSVFYPIIAANGKIVKPDSFVIGSERKDDPNRKFEIAKGNPGISKGKSVITVADFKAFCDSIFR